VSNQTAVWSLLVAQQGHWVSRAEIEKVGGLESLRRLREVRSQSVARGFIFEQRRKGGVLEYRVTPLNPQQTLSPGWVCAKCGARPANDPQPSTDGQDRWRIAWCVPCNNPRSIFQREKP
jgi:hypothetical protein